MRIGNPTDNTHDSSFCSFVINYDLPSREEYMRRSGRTGRYGRRGVCITFVLSTETEQVHAFEAYYNTTIEELPADLSNIYWGLWSTICFCVTGSIMASTIDCVLNCFLSESTRIFEFSQLNLPGYRLWSSEAHSHKINFSSKDSKLWILHHKFEHSQCFQYQSS